MVRTGVGAVLAVQRLSDLGEILVSFFIVLEAPGVIAEVALEDSHRPREVAIRQVVAPQATVAQPDVTPIPGIAEVNHVLLGAGRRDEPERRSPELHDGWLGRPRVVRLREFSRSGEGLSDGTGRSPGGARRHATAPKPFLATSVSSFNEAPCGRFSPRSHWLTNPVVTLR